MVDMATIDKIQLGRAVKVGRKISARKFTWSQQLDDAEVPVSSFTIDGLGEIKVPVPIQVLPCLQESSC